MTTTNTDNIALRIAAAAFQPASRWEDRDDSLSVRVAARAFGVSHGCSLSATCASLCWHIGGDVFVLDDEDGAHLTVCIRADDEDGARWEPVGTIAV